MLRLAKFILVGALFASPVVLHVATALHWPLYLRAVVIAVQLLIMLSLALGGWASRWKFAVITALSALVLSAAWRYGQTGLLVSAGLPHAAAHSALLVTFGSSLRQGAEPVITRIIRAARGWPLPDELVAYGRAVTRAWCAFFTAQLVISAGLLSFAPLEMWSLFVNVINLPSIAAMFLAEFICHRVRFRHLPPSRISDMVKAVTAWRSGQPGAVGAAPVGYKVP